MNEVGDSLHEISVPYCLSHEPSYYLVVLHYHGNGRYRDCIAFAVSSDSHATIDIMLPIPGLEEPSLLSNPHNLVT